MPGARLMAAEAILEVEGVSKRFGEARDLVGRMLARAGLERAPRVVQALEGVSFTLARGEVLGLVGESGCGKSTLGRIVAGLASPSDGKVRFRGRRLAGRDGLKVQMVFQDPFSSLNPRKRVADLVAEAPRVHGIVPARDARRYAEGILERCGVDPSLAGRLPHEFSGGQRQRIGIARALAVRPELLVADEAISALDVSIQAQVLNLFMDLRGEFGLTYLFISHDLGVIEHVADRVLVMYLGRIVESAPAGELFAAPNHPYTRALIEGVPRIDRRRVTYAAARGEIPSPYAPPPGCHFHPRCRFAHDRCRVERPALRAVAPGRLAACHLNDAT